MTLNQAKKIIKQELDRRGLPYTKLSARTISFADLARSEAIFVRVHGWKSNPAWTALQDLAKANGFFIET